MRNAIKMLLVRVQALLGYARQVSLGLVPVDYGILRGIKAIVQSFPSLEIPAAGRAPAAPARAADQSAYGDAELVALLAAVTQGTSILQQVVEKHLIANPSRGGGGGAGGGYGRSGSPPTHMYDDFE